MYRLISSGCITFTTYPEVKAAVGTPTKELHQIIVAASGSFDVLLDDGENKKVVT
jgi:hypothetical protein